MPEHNVFISRLNKLGVHYMITGSVASMIYGEPRLTHDIDLVIELNQDDIERFAEAFPIEEFYCPPPEVIALEAGRRYRGHFNLIHHETAFKADVYLSGRDSEIFYSFFSWITERFYKLPWEYFTTSRFATLACVGVPAVPA